MSIDSSVEEVSWEHHRDALRQVRHAVFVEEQGVPEELEWDDQEPDATHVLLRELGKSAACGRMTPDGRIGRMAVLPQYRGQGCGARVLTQLLEIARTKGLSKVHLHAQDHAIGFYLDQGFIPEGDVFIEADIPHLQMSMELWVDGRPRDPSGGSVVQYPQPFDHIVAQLCRNAQRFISVLSPTLDHTVFDNADILDAMSELARRSRHTRVRILISDPRPIVQRGHRLLNLSRRLPSTIEIQTLREHPSLSDRTVVIQDRKSVLYKQGDSDHRAFFKPRMRGDTARELELFDELWQYSRPDPQLRQLSL